MKLLHTSDWHLGRSLYGKKRHDEYEAFLDWLANTIEQNRIDSLLVAGDVFDSSTPPNSAQEQYYRFLCRAAASSGLRHIVIIAGNHDSPSFLSAPKELLKALNIHVVGSISGNPADEVLVLHDQHGKAELIVCAVPYLRDRDIRIAEAGDSLEDKAKKLLEGIRAHYAAVSELARRKRKELGQNIPIVGMGHLFTSGGQIADGDGVRELYVGSLAHVSADTITADFDYMALGHLHIPQRVNGSETVRYSGSVIPMGFGEALQGKSVCLVEFPDDDPCHAKVQTIGIPRFQKLSSIRGDWSHIDGRIKELTKEASQHWLEVIYEGQELITDLRERLEVAVEGSSLEVLRIKNSMITERVLGQIHTGESLEELDENDVFARLLDAHDIPGEQREELTNTYKEALSMVYEADKEEDPDGQP
ncbi:exonuclease SbcCD subunit D C-terminal domain-containing protein [Spirochaetota bacterium]